MGGLAVTDLQSKVHEADQDSQILWDLFCVQLVSSAVHMHSKKINNV